MHVFNVEIEKGSYVYNIYFIIIIIIYFFIGPDGLGIRYSYHRIIILYIQLFILVFWEWVWVLIVVWKNWVFLLNLSILKVSLPEMDGMFY